MGFSKLPIYGGIEARSQSVAQMQTMIAAQIRQEATKRTARNAGSANGKATTAKNKQTLAKVLAGGPATAPAPSHKPTPAAPMTNKARLAALLAD